MTVIFKPSPNFNERVAHQTPRFIILHYTGMKTAKEALERLSDGKSNVSAHYTIDEDGTIYQHVELDKRAWHAGKSFWRGVTDMNSASIGIEIVNPGHEHGYRPYPDIQISSLITFMRDLVKEFYIDPQNVLAHSDIAPRRKEDPGELFPWARLAQEGLALWPDPSEEDMATAKKWSLDDYVAAARKYGYDPDCGYEYVLRAFERHFAPELILGTSQDETLAKARLACLLRKYQVSTDP